MSVHETAQGMRAIFISYRRDDAEGQAGRLFKDLTERFGEDSVFMDVVDIEPGRDFRRVIDQQVASCGVLLAMIGKGWIDSKDDSGRRRLEDPGDFVRLETATALKRDIPVIPVLVQGARMPRADQLPPDLSDLAFRNGVELTHARWDSDVELLIKALRPHIETGRPNVRTPAVDTEAEAPVPSQRSSARSTAGEPTKADVTPATAERSGKKSPLVIAVVSAVVAAIAIGGYVAFDRSQREAAEERANAEKAAVMAEVEKARADAAAAQAAADAAAMRAEVEAAKAEAARAEAAKAEAAREEAARAEAARVDAAKAEAARANAAKAEAARAEAARAEAARTEAAKAEAARAEVARAEAAKAEAGRAEAARAEADRAARAKGTEPAVIPSPAQTTRFDGVIIAKDPCTGRTVTANGVTALLIQATPDGIVVQQQFRGSGDGFTVSYRGRQTFPRRAAFYDIPIAGQWSVDGRAQFTSRGVDRILSNPAGAPTGDRIQGLNNTCSR